MRYKTIPCCEPPPCALGDQVVLPTIKAFFLPSRP